ncbi:MAG: lysoplasmalogenase [Micrococcales bacterium]|nr:lysoplasmalogenase [Micrococcales bacterium]
MPTLRAPVAWAAYALLALVHLVAIVLGADALASVTQVLLMPVLAIAFLAERPSPGRPRALFLAGLFFSWVGDSLPRVTPESVDFVAMLGGFLLAQLAYIAAFWPARGGSVARRSPLLVLPYIGYAAALIALCAKGAGALWPAVVVYGAVLATMAVLATGVGMLGTLGGILFMLSDSLIALGTFVPASDFPGRSVVIMATYAAAQALLALGVLRRFGVAPAAAPVRSAAVSG